MNKSRLWKFCRPRDMLLIFSVAGVLLFLPASGKDKEETKSTLETAKTAADKSTLKHGDTPIHLKGMVEPDFGKEVDVSTRIFGRVKEVFVKPGQMVTKGDRLLTIDSREIGQLQAELIECQTKLNEARAQEEREHLIYEERLKRPRDLLAAKNAYRQAKIVRDLDKSQLTRIQGLVSEHIAAEKEMVSAKARFDAAQSEFEERQADLKREQKLYANKALMRREYALAQSQTAKSKQHLNTLFQRLEFLGSEKNELDLVLKSGRIDGTIIMQAPISGVISHYGVAAVGEIVQPDRPLLKITNLSTVLVRADLPELLLDSVKTGDPALIKIASYPQKTFQGAITSISELLDSHTHTVAIWITLDNSDWKLKSNMSADITLP